MKNRILVLTRDQDEFKKELEKLNLQDVEMYFPENEQEIQEQIQDVEIIFANPLILQNYINLADNVKWVQSTFAGIDALNRENLKKDYALTNMKDAYGEIIAEYILGYMLFLEKEMLNHYKDQENKIWGQKASPSLVGKKIGIMGIGSIGSVVGKYAQNFQMKTYGYATSYRNQDGFDAIFTQETLDDFLKDLDYIVSILPNTPKTQGIINADLLKKLPARAVFINVGRGANVVENDLIDALESNIISGAVLDVFQTEPLPIDSPLWTTKNTYITPHISGYVENNGKIVNVFEQNYKRYIKGEPLLYQVDFSKGY